MVAKEKERRSRIDFLWRVSHHYSNICPELAAFWGGKLLDVAGPASVTDRLCPACGTLLLCSPPSSSPSSPSSSSPSSSAVRLKTVPKKRLKRIRRKKKVMWLTKPFPRAKSCVMVNCRCGNSYATAVHGDMLNLAVSKMKPLKRSARRRNKPGLSKTLRGLLETSRQLVAQKERQKSSPSLSLFLTSLNSTVS